MLVCCVLCGENVSLEGEANSCEMEFLVALLKTLWDEMVGNFE